MEKLRFCQLWLNESAKVKNDTVMGRVTEPISRHPAARVEFPIQLVGRLPQQLYGLPHKFSMDFGVFRLQNVHVNPELCHDVRTQSLSTLKRPIFT